MQLSDLKNYTVVAGPQTGVSEKEAKHKNFGQKLMQASHAISNFVGAKGITDQFGASLARGLAPESQKNLVDFPTQKQVVGSAIQTGANLIPGLGEAGLATKIGIGAATGAAFDIGSKLQNDQPATPGIATVVGGALPLAGKAVSLVTPIVSRLFKGLGSGLSGVSTDTIDKIIHNPEVAQKASNALAKGGNAKILEENSRAIVNGISQIQKEARSSFGKGLEQLAKEDIAPKTFRESTQSFLDKYGVTSEGDKRILSNVEFDDPKNVQKASDLINKLSTTELDGKSLRKLSDDIENAKYKTATSDERLSFNAFINDLSSSLKGAIGSATGKLDEMNKAFTQDMQLAETAQDIFGNVNFKNLPEVVKASQKLEGLFSQKGLAPEVVDSFLTRIGISPQDFKTTEAVRQISNKADSANSPGTSVGEITRSVTSAAITPKMVKNIAIKVGMAEKNVIPFLKKLSPSVRKILLNELVNSKQK